MKFLLIISLFLGFISCKSGNDITVIDDKEEEKEIPIDDLPEDADNFYIESVLSFKEHVFPVLRNYCMECHNQNAESAVSPFFADSKIAGSHDAIIAAGKVNIGKIENSRLHQRAFTDEHNCVTFGCPKVASDILEALKKWEPKLDKREFKPQGIVSKISKISDSNDDVTTTLGGADEDGVIKEISGKRVQLKYTAESLKDITISLEIYQDLDEDEATRYPRYIIKNIVIETGNKPIAYYGPRVHINETYEADANKLVELTGVIPKDSEENISQNILDQDFTEDLAIEEGHSLEIDSIQISFERLQVFE